VKILIQEETKMADQNVVAKVEEAMKDEVFAQKLAETESAEGAQKLFAEKGIDFSLEEVQAIAKSAQQQEQGLSGELGEDDLEAVSGGVALTTVVTVAGVVLTGAKALKYLAEAWNIARKWRW
jgi:cellulase/cellobiase CelA1